MRVANGWGGKSRDLRKMIIFKGKIKAVLGIAGV